MNMNKEAEKLMTFLQGRGLEPDEACAVMGFTINILIRDRKAQDSFLLAMRNTFKHVNKVLEQ